MIDPLLPPPPPPPSARTPRATEQRDQRIPAHLRAPRAKHPALSARILAIGLSTTAMLGLTAGYALAGRSADEQPVNDPGLNSSLVPAAANPSTAKTPQAQPNAPANAQRSGTNPQNPSAQSQQPTAQPNNPVQQAPATSAPSVVEIPVTPAQPAQPGWSGGGTPQPSSGSN